MISSFLKVTEPSTKKKNSRPTAQRERGREEASERDEITGLAEWRASGGGKERRATEEGMVHEEKTDGGDGRRR